MDNQKDLSREQLFEILEHIYNEVYVVDGNMQIVYVNPACTKNYGLRPEEMIGHNHAEFTGNLWYPSVLPMVMLEKRQMSVEQVTYTGKKIIATATPLFDPSGEINLIVCVTDEHFEHLDIQYDPSAHAVTVTSAYDAPNMTEHCQFITEGPCMRALMKTAAQCARRDIPVLIQGESGTGKSMLAQYIHDLSGRDKGPFLSLNCAAIPENMLEVELFGCMPYAYTGAPPKGKLGIVEAADGGTLFLDEVGELPLPMQAKLLGVLETKTFLPVGGKETRCADVRIVAATNQNLPAMVAQKTFREDLFWRLDVVDLKMPPLRERGGEIDVYIDRFLQQFNEKYGQSHTLSSETRSLLRAYPWPGNIRQVKNTIERLVVTAPAEQITPEELPTAITQYRAQSPRWGSAYEIFRENCTRQIIRDAYGSGTSTRELAEALQISQSTASRLVRKYIENQTG